MKCNLNSLSLHWPYFWFSGWRAGRETCTPRCLTHQQPPPLSHPLWQLARHAFKPGSPFQTVHWVKTGLMNSALSRSSQFNLPVFATPSLQSVPQDSNPVPVSITAITILPSVTWPPSCMTDITNEKSLKKKLNTGSYYHIYSSASPMHSCYTRAAASLIPSHIEIGKITFCSFTWITPVQWKMEGRRGEEILFPWNIYDMNPGENESWLITQTNLVKRV